jgi:Arc/MetJ family transcription regulator
MRTTLTLDDDVAAVLARIQKVQRRPFKELVNDALRRGLQQLIAKPKARKPYRTAAVDLGRCHFASLDDVAEVLAVAEGESFK